MENIIMKARQHIDGKNRRSAWDKGVNAYAHDLLDALEEAIEGGYFRPENLADPQLIEKALLNGAEDWAQYSWGGCSLCYDGDIAERLCTPSELKRKRGGELRPNSREEWLDTQTRALRQASTRVKRAIKAVLEVNAK